MPNTALVLRATGAQGKGAVKHLLASGWTVHALVSDPENARSQELKSLGAILFKGTSSDAKSIESAIRGTQALFLAQMPSFTDDSEVKEATAIIELAKTAGVKHIVHSTTLPLVDPNVRAKYSSPPFAVIAPAILSKGDVEDLVQASGIPWTIIRPGYFMNNFITPTGYFPDLSKGKLFTYFNKETILPLVDPDDIGAFTVAAFNDPSKFQGQVIPLASQKLGVDEIGAVIGRVTAQPIDVSYATDEEAEKGMGNVYLLGQILSRTLGEFVDMEEVKSWNVPLTSFDAFLEKHIDYVLPVRAKE